MATYDESEVYQLINRAIIWNTDNKSTPLIDWWDENKKPESTPLSVEESAKAAGEDYVKKQGSHDRPDITLHDFMKGFLAGEAHREKPKRELTSDTQLTIGELTVNCFDEDSEMTLKVRNGKWLSLGIVEVGQLAHFLFSHLHHETGNSTDIPTPTPIPSDIVQALEEANPWKHGTGEFSYDRSITYNYCVSKLRELLSSQPSQGSVQEIIDILAECDKYLSEQQFVEGRATSLNNIGAGSILHKKMKQALQSFYSGNQEPEFLETPCSCPCHTTAGMIHCFPCCDNGVIKTPNPKFNSGNQTEKEEDKP